MKRILLTSICCVCLGGFLMAQEVRPDKKVTSRNNKAVAEAKKAENARIIEKLNHAQMPIEQPKADTDPRSIEAVNQNKTIKSSKN